MRTRKNGHIKVAVLSEKSGNNELVGRLQQYIVSLTDYNTWMFLLVGGTMFLVADIR